MNHAFSWATNNCIRQGDKKWQGSAQSKFFLKGLLFPSYTVPHPTAGLLSPHQRTGINPHGLKATKLITSGHSSKQTVSVHSNPVRAGNTGQVGMLRKCR